MALEALSSASIHFTKICNQQLASLNPAHPPHMVKVLAVVAALTEELNSRQPNLSTFHIFEDFMSIDYSRVLGAEVAYLANWAALPEQRLSDRGPDTRRHLPDSKIGHEDG